MTERWCFTEAAVWPDWVRAECELTEIDGELAIRHERRSGVQIYWLGEVLERQADGTVGFLSPPPVAGETAQENPDGQG